MAGGKGGGSWKVAYADFVTAMMAFFMVMWIGSQDAATRQAVAAYFVDPSGVSKNPVKTGAVYNKVSKGAVPEQEQTATGRGRNSYSSPDEGSWATKLIGEYVFTDAKAAPYWKEQAARARQTAADDPKVRANLEAAEDVAIKMVARQLREEIAAAVPTTSTGIYQDLIFGSVNEVNWTELAEDLVRPQKD
jgi:flagellar motor protein MotB